MHRDQQGLGIGKAIFHWAIERVKDYNPTKGKIEFWEIQHEHLIKLDAKVELTRGAHFLNAILD